MSPGGEHVDALAEELRPYFSQMLEAIASIRRLLEAHADGKKLKGDEIVGWLGEIYGKLVLDGSLVSDKFEHDLEAHGRRVSVKARKGWRGGFTQSGVIPKIDGPGCPSDLMFVHFNDDYSLDRIWLYPWSDLIARNRFRPFVVRGVHRGFVFDVNPSGDDSYVEYRGHPQEPIPRSWSAEKALTVKKRRLQLGLTQEKVGQLTGISRTRYSFIEYPKKITQPTPDELESITRVLGAALRFSLEATP